MAEPLVFPTLESGGLKPPSAPTTGIPSYDFLTGLGASTLGGATELFGVTPPGALEFRQDHPFVGFVSQLAAAAIPYTGWYKATKVVGAFDKAVRSIGKLEKAPFLTGAAREAARFAPFEVGRLGISQVIGDRPFSDMATDTALSLSLSGGIGGLVHGLAAAGTRNARKLIPGVDIAAPAPLQLRKMQELVLEGNLPPEQIGPLNSRIREFEILSRAERPLKARDKYVADVGNKNLTRILNSMFNLDTKAVTAVEHRPFITRADPKTPGFDSEKRWKGAALEAGLPANFPALGRYFRSISFRPTGRTDAVAGRVAALFDDLQQGRISQEDFTQASSRLASKDYAAQRAKVIDRQITEGMESLGNNYYMTREQPDGLFVMAKKVRGVPGTGTAQDTWVVFKTDLPGKFAPFNEKWKSTVLQANSWHKGATALADGGRIYNGLKGWQKHFPLQNVDVVAKPSRLLALVPKRLHGTSKEFAHRIAEGAREYLAPTAHQLKKTRLGNYILQSARMTYDNADTLAHEIVYGRRAIDLNRSLFSQALREGSVEPGEDTFRAILDKLDEKGLEELRTLWNKDVDPERFQELVLSGEITQNTADVALRLDQLESFSWGEYEKLLSALGETPKLGSRFHLGIPKIWEGDTRISILDAAGALRYVAAGPTRRAAQNNAKNIVKQFPDLRIGNELSLSQLEKIPPELKRTTGRPGALNDTSGLRGYKWDLEGWTKDEMLEAILASQSARARMMASKTVEDLLTQDRVRLAATDPVSSRIVDARINDLAGVQSEGSAWQNKVVDRVMAPMLGLNSATKIVSATNTAMFSWHLGMGNLAHPILNAMTFIQTVVPETAMIMRAGNADLSYYTHFAAGGTKGPVGTFGMLSPMRLMSKSIREMIRPREELLKAFNRAANDGVIAPRLVEEYIGENATKVTDLRKAFSSGKGFADWALALSSWLPANSEKLSRSHAFTVGYLLAKDVLRIENPEAVYRTARQFTEKTMFLYSSADRPRVFTTPAGSAMGLFKTWMMNYMANMLEYSGQAVKGNIAPLAWQTAGTAAVGGIAATPLYWIADGFSKAFSDDTLLQNTYNYLGEDAGDAFMYGLPSVLTGISLYSQVSSPLSNPARDASMLWSSVVLNRGNDLSKSVGLAFDHWQATGEHPGRSDRVRDAIVKSLAPSTISRVLSAFSGEEALRSLGTGYPMLKDVSLGDRLAYAFKFNPVELDKAMAVQTELYADREKRRERVIALGTAFAEAQEEKNSDQMRLIMRQSLIWGIDVSSVLNSAARRLQLREQEAVERLAKPVQLAPYREVLK